METLIVHTDGGARGNPGNAGIGIHIEDDAGNVLGEISEGIGNSTNNFAEYKAVARALQALAKKYGKATKSMAVELRMDSELVQKQLNHEYQIKDPGLIALFIEIHNLRVAHFPQLTLTHVPRAENKDADRLANEAMDAAER